MAHHFDHLATERAAALWVGHFDSTHAHYPPSVYWSWRMSPQVHARTYPWGIVLSAHAYGRVGKARRYKWLRGLLLHELLHWAGYSHRPPFARYARQLGTY